MKAELLMTPEELIADANGLIGLDARTVNFINTAVAHAKELIDPARLELTKAALTGLLAYDPTIEFAGLAQDAVALADATLAELRKPKEPNP